MRYLTPPPTAIVSSAVALSGCASEPKHASRDATFSKRGMESFADEDIPSMLWMVSLISWMAYSLCGQS